jgi:hypothetical protein
VRRAVRGAGFALALGLPAALLSGGCASSRVLDEEATRMFRRGQYTEVADRLGKGLAEQGENSRDELLYLMDIGLSLHAAGKYEESNKAFLKADKIAEINDYTSLATEGATLLVSENIQDYKGEDFEKVLINTYLSMNYALMGDWENALVEARRVNRKLYLMVSEGERKYKQNAFARYLSAALYEAEGNWNDAYIDYKETYKLEPSFRGIGLDLWRAAAMNGIRDEMDHWDEEFKLTDEDHVRARSTVPQGAGGRKKNASPAKAEIIVLYENGISPVKKPNPNFYSVPKFFPRFNPVRQAHVEAAPVSAPGIPSASGDTAVLHDIQATAIENLDEKYGGIIAKKIAGVVAKEVVADQIGRHTDPALGALMRLVFYAADQADCRSWNLLPRDLQIARLTVDAGTYTVRAHPVGGGSAVLEKTVQAGPGKKIFVNFRYMP